MALNKRGKVFFSIVFVLVGLAVSASAFLYDATRGLPDIGDIKSVAKSQTTYIYASDGTLITKLFQENRTIVPLKQISPVLQKAVISVEDQRFYEHRGVDYVRIIGALIRDIRHREAAQGGSTITQQYVKNAYFSSEKTITRKIREAFLATKLERTYTKEEILEKYLNTIYFGNGAYGIEAAAQSYFGVPASKLNAEQSALLAGMIKAPETYNPYKNPAAALERRNLVLRLMNEQGYVTSSEEAAGKARPLTIQPKQTSYRGIAPYFVEWIKTELKNAGFSEKAVNSQGLRIHTTLNPKMQESAELSWKKYLPRPNDPEVALVAIDPKSGAVRAMVGGKDFLKQQFNIAAQGPGRQPGSAFKPFTLAAALMNGVSPDDGFNASSPRTFKVPGSTPWKVHNYSGESGSGIISLRKATALSVNVVFAELILKVGVDKVIKTAEKLGITKGKLNPDPAITLGGLENGVTPLEMANAYATFANNGERNKAYGIERVELANGEVAYKHEPNPVQVIDKAVAYLVTDALKGVIQGGTGTRAKIGRPAAGKTGTSQKYVDAWFCGYTPDLVAAVWVGYKRKAGEDPKPMTNVHGRRVAGGTFPAQIWASFMKRSLKGVKAHNFSRAPSGSLVQVLMDDETNMLATEFCQKTSNHVFVRKYRPKKLKKCDVHKPIIIPDLIGLTQGEATKKLTELKLGYNVTNKPFDGSPGQVIEQTPTAGAKVKEGTVVELSVSIKGTPGQNNNQVITVPNVVGMPADQAKIELERLGFVVSGEYRQSNDPPNQVIAQRPLAGFLAEPGSTVKVIISGESGGTSGTSGTTSVAVPDVKGMSEATARSTLESKGFEVSVVNDTSERNVRKYGSGVVFDQSPNAGTTTSSGSKVTIYVTSQG
ncbi:MAG TPA: PBP1A family penicillin-binding protein [Anaerolineae bacterium]|nr:PBP1A family penicillin-binding protein [Anaerolineae bacterium]